MSGRRILIANWMDLRNPASGGAEVHLQETFAPFAERGDELHFVCSNFSGGAASESYDGIHFHRVGDRNSFQFRARARIKQLERQRDFDLVVEDINKVPLFLPLYVKKPSLVVIPHLFGGAVFRETNPLLGGYVYAMERLIPLVYRDSYFEVISESTEADLIRRGIPRERIRTIHCGIDHSLYAPDPATERFEQPTVLFVGRLKKYKGADIAVRAMPAIRARVPDARLVVLGSGDFLPSLRRSVAELGLESAVDFRGFVSQEEKVDWMRRSHVAINPSPKEGWGLNNIECNACGTPCVATDADGLRDSVRDGETGFLFPYGDLDALAERVIRLLQDEQLWQRFSENSLRWASRFEWSECSRLTREWINQCFPLDRGTRS